MRPITFTLLPLPNEAILVSSLALIFNLSFLAKSFEMIYTKAFVLIKIGRSVSIILINIFNDYNDLYCLDIKV